MNYDRWKHLLNGNDLEPMDWRHVRMINASLVGELSEEKPFVIVNIGIANGFSSSATVEYLESKNSGIGIFIDKKIRDSFIKATETSSVVHRMSYHECSSLEKRTIGNCFIIDGCHKDGAIDDYEHARKVSSKIIIAHDTSEDWAPDIQWGAIEIGRRMRKDSVTYFEDRQKRHKEHTHRGLIIAFYYQPKPETIDRLKELANYENPFQ